MMTPLHHHRRQKTHPHPQNPSSSLLHLADDTLADGTLYCQEDNSDYSSQEQWSNCDGDVCAPPRSNPSLEEQNLPWIADGDDEEELPPLSSREEPNHLRHCVEMTPSLADSRRCAVDWMLNVAAFYSFSAHTAVLAVNYLDRFLFAFQSHHEKKPWMSQLAAVACLSLAAKVEETQVPLLLDLQVEESKYVFEAKTIQRMEILVLSTLQWRMNPVTPLSFLDYIARSVLGLKNCHCWKLLRRSEFIILSIISDCRFMRFLPSVMAVSTMLNVIGSLDPSAKVEYQSQMLSNLGIDKEEDVEDCSRLIQDLESRGHFRMPTKRKFVAGSLPGSPRGVTEVTFTSDSSAESAAASVSSSPEPLPKKKRAENKNGDADIVCTSHRC